MILLAKILAAWVIINMIFAIAWFMWRNRGRHEIPRGQRQLR